MSGVDASAYMSSFAEGGSKGNVGSPSSFGPSGANTPATAAGTPRATTPVPKSHPTEVQKSAQDEEHSVGAQSTSKI